MSKTLVINTPFLEPHRPPISAAIIAEIARLQGHTVTVADLNIEIFHAIGAKKFYELQTKHTTDSDPEVTMYLQTLIEQQLVEVGANQFDWVLCSCFSFWNQKAIEYVCKWLRSNTSAKIVIGGPGIEFLNFGKTLHESGLVDFYVYGEAEHSLPLLFQGSTNAPGINGTPPQQIEDIENLPLPNYEFFDLNRYDWLLDSPDVFIYGSRGCVRKCTFCDVAKYWPKFRWRSGESIANEMISNYERFGVKNYFFADSLVNGNMKEFTKMVERLANYKQGLFNWGGYAIVRPKVSHPASLFDVIEASGAKFWSLGIETGVDRIRFEMGKKFTNDDIDWHLEQSQRIGLQNNFLLISTWPSETLQEHEEYLRMFSRWQNYAVDGTIFGIAMGPTLSILDHTPLAAQEHSLWTHDQFQQTPSPEVMSTAWRVPTNPDLTHREKFRRSLAIYETALEYNWPLVNPLQKISELKQYVTKWVQLQDHIVPQKQFLIKQIQ